jgi:cell division protein FtsW
VTLLLAAAGAVMVYSASSTLGVINGHGGTGAGEFLHYLVYGCLGLAAMFVLERHGLALLDQRVVTVLLAGSFALLVLVRVPGFGVSVNNARRWFAAGPIQFQPSEVMKLVLVLYAARLLSERGSRIASFRDVLKPLALVVGPACLLIMVEPDLGTAMVIVFTIITLLVAAGMPLRYLAALVAVVAIAVLLLAVARPWELARLTTWLDPWRVARSTGYQAVQGQVSLGSGGLTGLGLGKGIQKIYWLPEAQTDFILAVVGEELGVLGICGLLCLYGALAYAGLKTARAAVEPYTKLLATGLTALILCQAILNIFVVLGLAPLTGVPLPFISYAPTNLCVMLASVGLLLNISRQGGRRLRAVPLSRGRSGRAGRAGGPRRRGLGGAGDRVRAGRPAAS